MLKCSSPSLIDGGEQSSAFLEKCFKAPNALASGSTAQYGPVMKGQYGALGAVTLEKGKLDLTQKQSKSSPEVSSFMNWNSIELGFYCRGNFQVSDCVIFG